MDPKTLFICLFIINLFNAVFMFIVKLTQKTFPGINHWIISSICGGFAYLFMLLRGEIRDIFSVILAQILFLFYGIIKFYGLKSFFYKKSKILEYILFGILFLFYVLILSYFTFIYNSIFIRTWIIGIVVSSISILMGIAIIKNMPKKNGLPYIFMGSLFFLFSLIFFLRLIAWSLFPEIRELLKSSIINNVYFLSSMVIDIVWTTLFFVINSQRLFHELFESETLKQTILDGITENIAFVNDKLEIIWANKTAALSVNKIPQEMKGQKCYELWADPEKPCDNCPTFKAFKTKIAHNSIINTPDGRIWNESGVPIFDNNKELIGVVEIARDITEFKRNEVILAKSLEEKEILLKELYHRTKNNMNVISSLLNLQTRNINDDNLKEVIKNSIARIRSMSLVHQKLYNSSDLSGIKFKDYIESLITQITGYYIFPGRSVDVILNIDDYDLSIDVAVPLGLVINEIITNSFKYAFNESKKGEIFVSLKKDNENFLLSISDNGIGISNEYDILNRKTFGISLIFDLVEKQLDGKVDFENNNGLKYNIFFKDNYSGRVKEIK